MVIQWLHFKGRAVSTKKKECYDTDQPIFEMTPLYHIADTSAPAGLSSHRIQTSNPTSSLSSYAFLSHLGGRRVTLKKRTDPAVYPNADITGVYLHLHQDADSNVVSVHSHQYTEYWAREAAMTHCHHDVASTRMD